MIIDGVFKNLPDQITEYQELLKAVIVLDQHGGNTITLAPITILYVNYFENIDPKIPMYYYVSQDYVEQERSDPNSTVKCTPDGDALYLWNQALFILAQLLTGGLLHINELDPIRRYLPSYNRPRKGGRYSAFQVNSEL